MWNIPSIKQLSTLPKLYDTEAEKSEDKKVLMHFFIGSSDWYIVEYSPEERLFFGYCILNGDLQMAEWGYVSLDELIDLKVGFVEVDRDLHWKTCKFSEIKKVNGG